jgi:hypothetical protein
LLLGQTPVLRSVIRRLLEFGDAFDDGGYVAAELVADFGQADDGIFGDIVHERRDQGVCIQPVFAQFEGDCDRVGKIKLARLTALVAVRLTSERVRGPNPRYILW